VCQLLALHLGTSQQNNSPMLILFSANANQANLQAPKLPIRGTIPEPHKEIPARIGKRGGKGMNPQRRT
jgi:hypothetical protein